MYKNTETGDWEHDFRIEGLPRYRACYGSRKADAERLHAVAVAVFRANDVALVAALKGRRATLEQFAQLRERGRPFADALSAANVVEPWPTLAVAVENYLQAVDENQKKSRGTYIAAESQLKRFVTFAGGDTPLDAITTARVSEYQSLLVAEGYAVNTVTNYVWRVSALFRWFMRREERDARDLRRPPRPLYIPIDHETVSTAHTKRTRFLAEPEAQRIISATPEPLLFPICCGLFAGFRVAEMMQLRTGFDVDLELGTLAVQVQPTWKPKTERSIRHVPIGSMLRPILERHLAKYSNDQWVTPARRDSAQPMTRHYLGKHLKRIVENAGLVYGIEDPTGVTYHTLRHTFASWLLMKGADLYTTAKLMGDSVKTIEDTYGHLSKDHRLKAVEALAGAVAFPETFATSGAT